MFGNNSFFTIASDNYIWLWIALIIFLLPVLVLSFIVFIKIIIKQRARFKVNKTPKTNFIELFGGLENIISTKRTENRISVEVKTLELVNFEGLRIENVGAMVVGNTIKCSSALVAEQLQNIK